MIMSSCAGTHAMAMCQPFSYDGVHGFLDMLFGDYLHAKRVKSLAGATLGTVADRGFGDHKLYRVLTEELKFDFVIRFRGNIAVTTTSGEARAAADWVGAGGRARTLRGAAVTAEAYPVATGGLRAGEGHERAWAPCGQHRRRTRADLDQPLCQALGDRGRFPRWTKDLRFGMGLGSMHVSTPDRRETACG